MALDFKVVNELVDLNIIESFDKTLFISLENFNKIKEFSNKLKENKKTLKWNDEFQEKKLIIINSFKESEINGEEKIKDKRIWAFKTTEFLSAKELKNQKPFFEQKDFIEKNAFDLINKFFFRKLIDNIRICNSLAKLYDKSLVQSEGPICEEWFQNIYLFNKKIADSYEDGELEKALENLKNEFNDVLEALENYDLISFEKNTKISFASFSHIVSFHDTDSILVSEEMFDEIKDHYFGIEYSRIIKVNKELSNIKIQRKIRDIEGLEFPKKYNEFSLITKQDRLFYRISKNISEFEKFLDENNILIRS